MGWEDKVLKKEEGDKSEDEKVLQVKNLMILITDLFNFVGTSLHTLFMSKWTYYAVL